MRRTFRRHIRKTLAPNVPPILQEANFTFDKGEYGRAAELYENLARTTDARDGSRAPFFHLQAGRARVYAGQTKLGLPSLKRGLELFAQRGQIQILHQSGGRLVSDLQDRGLTDEAHEMKAWIMSFSPTISGMNLDSPPGKRPLLPTHCPACGAPIRPEEVEWLDLSTAECAYCGSSVR